VAVCVALHMNGLPAPANLLAYERVQLSNLGADSKYTSVHVSDDFLCAG
jgi:hypothetical protein